jgi:hypothetical protein
LGKNPWPSRWTLTGHFRNRKILQIEKKLAFLPKTGEPWMSNRGRFHPWWIFGKVKFGMLQRGLLPLNVLHQLSAGAIAGGQEARPEFDETFDF